MKKFVRFVFILVLIVLVGIMALGMYEPKDVTVTRTIMIKAPKEAVFAQIVQFKNWPNWCPWYIMDSGKMKMTYYGIDGQPGSGFSWDGDKTGSGDIRDSAINGPQMTYVFNIISPQEKNSWGDLKAEDSAGMTKATWTWHTHFPFPFNAALIRLDMDKLMGNDFEAGLNYLKTYVEAHEMATNSPPTIEVMKVDYPAHTFEEMRKVISTANMTDITNFFKESYTTLGKELGNKINGSAAGIYFTWDTVKKETDMAAAFPVSDTAKAVKDASVMYIGDAKAVMAVLKGGYGREMEAHTAIMKYMAAKGLVQSMVVEEYAVGPFQEPDSTKWVTNIYYLIK